MGVFNCNDTSFSKKNFSDEMLNQQRPSHMVLAEVRHLSQTHEMVVVRDHNGWKWNMCAKAS